MRGLILVLEESAKLPSLLLRLQSSASSGLENLSHSLVEFSRTLQVGKCPNFLRHRSPVLCLDRFLLGLGELPTHLVVETEIFLVSDEDDGNGGAEMPNFGRPFLGDVLEAVRAVDGETHEDYVSVGVGEGTQAIVVFLAWMREREREREGKYM